jgi:hypothetical protein
LRLVLVTAIGMTASEESPPMAKRDPKPQLKNDLFASHGQIK